VKHLVADFVVAHRIVVTLIEILENDLSLAPLGRIE
jgi:hypothetical protein